MKYKRLIRLFFVQSVAILFFSFILVPQYFSSFSSKIKSVNYVSNALRFADNLTIWHQIPHRRILIYPVAYEDFAGIKDFAGKENFAGNESQTEKVIKVLAAKDHWEKLLYICYGYQFDGKVLELGEAKDDLITASQYSLFDAYFIYCPCQLDQCFERLVGISVIEKSNSSKIPKEPMTQIPKDPMARIPREPMTQIPRDPMAQIPKEPMARIQRFYSGGGFEHNFTVCVSTMASYSLANQLELFLKFYKSHGVSKFVFYYQNSSYEVERVLQKAQNNPNFGAKIELILWPNPIPDLKLVS